jgi:hypothetical protein
MATMKEPKLAESKGEKSKKKDKKLSVADGAVKKKAEKKAAKSEKDDSAALCKKARKSKREMKDQVDEVMNELKVDSCVAEESSPSKALKKTSAAKEPKRKRDSNADCTPAEAPKKGKPEGAAAGHGQDGETATVNDVKVPPPALLCHTSPIPACRVYSKHRLALTHS